MAARQPMGHPWGWGATGLFMAHLDDRCGDCGQLYPKGRLGDANVPMGLAYTDGSRRCGPCAQARWEATG